MRISVSTYSFGKYASRGLSFMIDEAARLGFEGIEFCLEGDETDDDLTAAARRARDAGIETVCSCVGADFLNRDRSREIVRLKEDLRRAALLGVPLLRHDVSVGLPGKLSDGDYAEALPILAGACWEVTEFARELGIRTCTENHGCFSQDAERVKALVLAVGDGNFGALCDVGNFMCADARPPESVRTLAPLAFHVHAKDFLLAEGHRADDGWFPTRGGDSLCGTVVGEGDAQVKESFAALREAGYGGFVTIEYEGTRDPIESISKGRENLIKIINGG